MKKQKYIFKKEWFGGFEYGVHDNHIAELSSSEFEHRIDTKSMSDQIITSDCNHKIPFPVRLNLDLTYLCNRQCRYCHSDSGHFQAGNENIGVEIARDVFEDTLRMGIFEITITGGEPLLNPSFWEIIGLSTKYNAIYFNVITNGTLITRDNAKKLALIGFNKINVSLDALESENDNNRWNGAFREAVQAIKYLLEAKCNVGVISVITKANCNIRRFSKFVNMLFDIGVRNHNVSTLCDIGRAQNNWNGISLSDFLSFSRNIYQIIQEMKSKGYLLTFNDALLEEGEKPARIPIYSFNDAVPGWKCTIRANGDVIYDRVWGNNFFLGNVKQNRLFDIWINSEDCRRTKILDVYNLKKNNTIIDIYARHKRNSKNSWKWLSSLDNYYR